MKGCLEADLDQEIADMQAQKQTNDELLRGGEELRARLKAVRKESEEIVKYNM